MTSPETKKRKFILLATLHLTTEYPTLTWLADDIGTTKVTLLRDKKEFNESFGHPSIRQYGIEPFNFIYNKASKSYEKVEGIFNHKELHFDDTSRLCVLYYIIQNTKEGSISELAYLFGRKPSTIAKDLYEYKKAVNYFIHSEYPYPIINIVVDERGDYWWRE